MARQMQPAGIVWFIGAGPGDPDLITVKGRELIARADVIIYAGSLVDPAVLDRARPAAEVHDSAGLKLDEQVRLMDEAVRQGKTVARVHTGDPSIFGATLEQMRELDTLGIPYAIVPGVSSAFAAAAALGIEFTVPGDTQTVIFTRLSGRTPVPDSEALRLLAAHHSSLVVFLSAGMVPRVVDEFVAAGYGLETPVAVVYRASWPDQLVVRGTLGDIAAQVEAAEVTHQALIVVSPALDPAKVRGTDARDSHLYGAALEAAERRSSTAIVTLTRGGTALGRRLRGLLPGAVLYAPERFLAAGEPAADVIACDTSIRQTLQSAFQAHEALICIMATGIVVRELAPFLRSKHADPAVVVLDERGRHAISLLGGHRGGANELARRVATLLGGTAVITTSSDVQELPAIDLLAVERGWTPGRTEQMTAVSAALVNGDTFGWYQDAGDDDWLPEPLPANIVRFDSLEELAATRPQAVLLVTYRCVPQAVVDAVPRMVVFHPRCLVVGVGCNRGTAAAEIDAALVQTLADAGFELRSVSGIATIADKAGEVGLRAAADARAWPLSVFTRDEVRAAGAVPNPSPWAQRELGVPGVAEPAAVLGAAGGRLLVEKRKFANVTVAVALRDCRGAR